MSSKAITVDELDATVAAHNVEVRPGDILLVRTGWETAYMAADQSTRDAVAVDLHSPGLKGSREMAGWL